MAAETLRVLCVHGVGGHGADLSWQDDWADAILAAVRRWDAERQVLCEFVLYDDIFEEADLSFFTTVRAVWKLLGSGVGGLFRRRGLLDEVQERTRWTAGMVVQWVENDGLREQTRARLRDAIDDFNPDVVCGHSLGSLICYDLATEDDSFEGRTFVSLGSQIANPFVRGNFLAGRVVPVRARYWYNLYNRNDRVFTSPVRLDADNFEQVETPFDEAGDIANHSAVEYLSHPNTVGRVWRELAAPRRFRALRASSALFDRMAQRPRRRALLVGINDYPDPAQRLEGCVNDVFLMSAVLQECGFAPDDVRVVLDGRATAAAIRERLAWLLEGTGPGDQRVFYYSGHGARLPGYGPSEEVDHVDECLVPYDFDWSAERAVTDDWLFDLYGQLPYDAHFVMVLDCCHAGGMARGGAPRARGIDPPDDVRHRLLRWDVGRQVWVPRDLEPLNKALAKDAEKRRAFVGESGAVRRLGRAVALRQMPRDEYVRERAALGHKGPYLPVILQACEEKEYAFEYRHGVTSHGAFTYCLAKNLREHARVRRRPVTFNALVKETARELQELEYDQSPCAVGPVKTLRAHVPWGSNAGGGGAASRNGRRTKARRG